MPSAATVRMFLRSTLCRGARPGTSGCPRGALRPADADRSQRSAIASLENTDRLYPGESGQCHHPRRTGLHCRYESIAAREGLPRIDWLHTDRVCGKAEDQGGPALACFDQRPGIPDSDRSWLRGSEPFHPTVSLGDRSDSCSVSPTGTVMGRFDRGFGSPGARGSSSAMLHRTPLAERRIISGQEYACRLARRHGVSASVTGRNCCTAEDFRGVPKAALSSRTRDHNLPVLLVRCLHVAAPYCHTSHATRPQKSEMGMSGAGEPLTSGELESRRVAYVLSAALRPDLPPKSLERLPLMVVKMIMLPCPGDSNASRSNAASRIVQDARLISSG